MLFIALFTLSALVWTLVERATYVAPPVPMSAESAALWADFYRTAPATAPEAPVVEYVTPAGATARMAAVPVTVLGANVCPEFAAAALALAHACR